MFNSIVILQSNIIDIYFSLDRPIRKSVIIPIGFISRSLKHHLTIFRNLVRNLFFHSRSYLVGYYFVCITQIDRNGRLCHFRSGAMPSTAKEIRILSGIG